MIFSVRRDYNDEGTRSSEMKEIPLMAGGLFN